MSDRFSLAWATDLHLSHADGRTIDAFLARVTALAPHAFLITGDLATAAVLEDVLAELEALPCPVYYVLGNHDYYGDAISAVRFRLKGRSLGRRARGFAGGWLQALGPVALTSTTALVGVDGWADGRAGDFVGSPGDVRDHPRVRPILDRTAPEAREAQLEALLAAAPVLRTIPTINDYRTIEELTGLPVAERRARLETLADDAARRLRCQLEGAATWATHLIVATHVPPFRDAAWHEGQPSNDQYAPHAVCTATGRVLLEFADAHPAITIDVRCGHTHSAGTTQPRPTLRVTTGSATYRCPAIADVLELP